MSSANEKANLTRIRDNQRRSRARRKEYLRSLEERWRACELQGVEASTDIQAAARKVAEENRRLRGLLKARGGMSDGEIDRLLKEEEDKTVGVEGLERLLGVRRPCEGESSRVGCEENISHRNDRGQQRQQCHHPPSTTAQSPTPTYQLPSFYDLFNSSSTNPNNPNLTPSQIVPSSNTTSCLLGATLITDMGAKASEEEVTAAMGCPPGAVGNCEVDNTMLLGVMDRFTGGVV